MNNVRCSFQLNRKRCDYELDIYILISDSLIKELNWSLQDRFAIICDNQNPYLIKIIKNWTGHKFYSHTKSGSSFKVRNWTPFIPKTYKMKEVLFWVEGESLTLLYEE
jgi:hypothetical protein